MTRTINNSVSRAVTRAWLDGMTLKQISKLFSISFEDTIHTIYSYMTKPIKDRA